MFEWLQHAWTAHDPGVTELLIQSFPASLQGRPALHRLRAKGRGDAERVARASRALVSASPGNGLHLLITPRGLDETWFQRFNELLCPRCPLTSDRSDSAPSAL